MVIEEIKQIRAYLFFALSFSNPVAEIPLCSERLSHFKKICDKRKKTFIGAFPFESVSENTVDRNVKKAKV